MLVTSLAARAASAQQGDPLVIAGVVVDPRGRAVEGARLGTSWWFDWQAPTGFGKQQVWDDDKTRATSGWRFVETKVDGSFSAKILPERRSKRVQLVVYSPDHRLAGAFAWDSGDDLRDLRLTLEPVARFRATLTCDAISRRGIKANAFLRSFDGRRLGRARTDSGGVDLRLPPGHYTLYVYGSGSHDVESRLFPFAVASGEDARARDIDIAPTWVAKHRGRPIPLWRATAARGLDLERTDYASFAGKWLLVCMWNCESVEPSEDIPQLLRFDRAWRKAHPGEPSPYQILLLHSGGAGSLAELDAQIARLRLRASHWGAAPLPFPVLLDPTEQTSAVWPARGRRQTLLIDPRGRLWGDTFADEDLSRAVEGKLEPVEAARPKKG